MGKLLFLLGGVALGLAGGVLWQQPRTQPGTRFVERCKARRAWLESLPDYAREDYLARIVSNDALRVEWEVVYACARLADDESDKNRVKSVKIW